MLAFVLAGAFLLLGLLHLYWALGGRIGMGAVLPEVDGKPAFMPSALATLVVTLGLFACAALVAAVGGIVAIPISMHVLRGAAYILAAVLFLRVVGDFRLVGLFKRVRGTRFAAMDTWVYSPICFALGLGVLALAAGWVG